MKMNNSSAIQISDHVKTENILSVFSYVDIKILEKQKIFNQIISWASKNYTNTEYKTLIILCHMITN